MAESAAQVFMLRIVFMKPTLNPKQLFMFLLDLKYGQSSVITLCFLKHTLVLGPLPNFMLNTNFGLMSI